MNLHNLQTNDFITWLNTKRFNRERLIYQFEIFNETLRYRAVLNTERRWINLHPETENDYRRQYEQGMYT